MQKVSPNAEGQRSFYLKKETGNAEMHEAGRRLAQHGQRLAWQLLYLARAAL